MEELTGTFINKDNNVKITFNPDKTFSIRGLGDDSFSGRYWFEDSKIAGFPYYLVLQRNDVCAFGNDRALINIVNQDTFKVFDKQFWEEQDSYNSEIAVYSKTED